MTPDLWHEVSDCLDRLMDLAPASADAYLRQLRAERPELAAEVESLWQQKTIGTRFNEPPTVTYVEPSPADPPAVAGTAGGYELLGEIARGGMGAVYEARDPTFDRTLAVKVLLPELRHHPEARHRFLREARITGRLQHPGIPPIHEFGQLSDGSPFFAMKLIRGRTLSAILKDRKPDPAEAVATFEQVCRTLAYAHDQGTIHRDLKPGNVMVGAFGEVQVMDWGLAKILPGGARDPPEARATHVPRSEVDPDHTQAGDVRGTPSYMAPEQARGDAAELDERCDVFGLGGTLVAMLTRQPTYTGTSAEALRQAVAGEVGLAIERVEAEKVDADLLAIVRRCLAPRKEDRYRHAGEVADAVTAYRESARKKLEAAEVARQTAVTQAREEQRRRRITLALGAALLLVVSAGLGVSIWLGSLAEEQRVAAVAAEVKVSQEKDRTEDTAKQARKAIKESFILATENPEFQKHGMQEARRLLLDRALEFYREFTTLRADDAALREEVADAHGRIGEIFADRGENRDALAAYDVAIGLYRRLKEEQPGERRFAERLADLFLKRAFVEQLIGRGAGAADSLRAARGELAPILAAEPDNPEWVYLDARILGELGRWYYAQGKLNESAAADQEALDKLTRLIEVLKVTSPQVATKTAGLLVGLGHVRKDQRRPADALALYQRAAPHLEYQHKANPTPDATAELARLYGSLALVQDDLGQLKEAVGSLRKAIGYREQLVQANPLVPEYRSDLATSHVNLANTLRNLNPADPDARRALDTAVEITDELAKRHPDVVVYLRQAALIRTYLANKVRQNPKDVAKAEEILTVARKHLDEIDRRKAMTPLFRQTLAEWEAESGQVERIKEKYTEAVKHFAAAERVYRELIAEGFQVENCRYAVARQQMSFAYAAMMSGDYDGALRAQYVGVEQLTDLLKVRKDDSAIKGSLEKAQVNMIELGKQSLDHDRPPPAEKTVPNMVAYREYRFTRWREWFAKYPLAVGFREAAAMSAVGVAVEYAVQLDPARHVAEKERADALAGIAAALKLARENGLQDAKIVEDGPAFVHFRKLPEYQQFLKTLK